MKKVWIIIGVLAVLAVVVGSMVNNVMAKNREAMKERQESGQKNIVAVERGPILVNVIETGSLEADRIVDVKSRVGGRVAQLYVDEGDFVQEGELIAIIDPEETELQVQQNRAQIKGARANVNRLDIEIAQNRETLKNAVTKAEIRVSQLEKELNTQPVLSTAAVNTAQTSVTSAQKSHDLLVNVTQPNAKIAAEKAVDDAQNNLDKAKLDEDRQRELYELGFGNRRNWEQAELQRQLYATQLNQAKDALSRLENEQQLERDRSMAAIDQAKAELDRAKANTVQDDLKAEELASARADLANARANLKNVDILIQNKVNSQATVEQLESVLNDSVRQLNETEIRAPFTGIISKRHVQVGELVNALSTFSAGSPIFTLEDRSSMVVNLQINEIDVARLVDSMNAVVVVDAFPNEEFSGTVNKIAPSQFIAAQGGTPSSVVKYEVEVRLDNTSDKLKGGMSAKCTMKAIDLPDALRVRSEYVGLDENGRFVERVTGDPDEKGVYPTERVAVQVGPSAGSYVQILNGVSEGDEIKRPEYKGPSRRGMMQFGPDDGGDEEESSESDESSEE